jgi:hypothetical protein
MATSRNDDCAGVYFEQGTCKIILKQGDLFNEKDVDVIVIPTPGSGVTDSHTYPLFEKLSSRADPSLKQQIKRLSGKIQQREPPQIISDAKPSIILTPIPYFGNENKAPKMLQDTYTACLKLAVIEHYQTIAFPAIGCGKSGFNLTDAAEILYKAITGFQQSNKGKLNEIRIVIYDKDIYNQFTNVFMDRSQDKNAKIKLIEMYELLYTILCLLQYFDLDSCFLNHHKAHLILIRVLDCQEIQTDLRCHRQKKTAKHHETTHNVQSEISNE